jgi:sulfite exporter TauE/SafE
VFGVEPIGPGSLFLLGLLGTGHCLGMCGPLVVALPGGRPGLSPHLLYHLGRLSTYTVVGAALGLLGGQLDDFARVQIGLSLGAALFLVLFALVRLGVVAEPRWMAGVSPERVPGFGRLVGGAIGGRSKLALLALGLLLGLLPCGLSYAAFARALPSGGALGGATCTLAFGLGTLPGLLALGTVASSVARRHQRLFDLLAGMLMLALAAQLMVDALVVL